MHMEKTFKAGLGVVLILLPTVENLIIYKYSDEYPGRFYLISREN